MTTKCKPNTLIEGVWTRLMWAQTRLLSEVEREMKAKGLPPLAWYDVLLEVERAGKAGLRPYELERHLLLAQYNLSRLLDRVEKAGYISRQACQMDGRGRVIRITRTGKALRRKMWPVYAEAIQRSLGSRLTEHQAGQLNELLGRLLETG